MRAAGPPAFVDGDPARGAVPGAFFGGWLGDKIGRRTVFILSAVTIALVTCVVVFTPGQDGFDPGGLFLMFSASSSFLRPSRPARPLVALPLLGS